MALPRGLWSTRDASDLISDTEGEQGLHAHHRRRSA